MAGALLAAFGIMLGAFGAHGLRETLSPQALVWWQTAVQYQMWNAVGLVALGAVPGARLGWPAASLAAGTLLLSGSLYLLALGGPSKLGFVAPAGGALMIAGWLWAAWRLARAN